MKALIEIGAADAGIDAGDRDQQPADEPGEHRAEREADEPVEVDRHAHELRGDPVLRQRPHRAAGLGELHHQDEGDDEEDREARDERCGPRAG